MSMQEKGLSVVAGWGVELGLTPSTKAAMSAQSAAYSTSTTSSGPKLLTGVQQ